MPQCNIKKPLQRPLALFSQSLGPGPVWTQITLDKLQISIWSRVNKVAFISFTSVFATVFMTNKWGALAYNHYLNNRAYYVTCMGRSKEKCYYWLNVLVSGLLYVSKTVIMKLGDKLIKDYDPAVKVNINKNDQSLRRSVTAKLRIIHVIITSPMSVKVPLCPWFSLLWSTNNKKHLNTKKYDKKIWHFSYH